MKLNLNFTFPSIGNLWFKRGAKLFILASLIFTLYAVYQWVIPKNPEIYRIGLDSSWYPLALHGKEQNKTAFTQNLLLAIARDQSLKFEIIKTNHKRMMDLVETGQLDAVLTSHLPNRNLEEKFDFSEPYYRYGAVLVTRKNSTIGALDHLDKKRLGVQRNSPILYKLQTNCDAAVVPYNSLATMLQGLADEDVDAILLDQSLLYVYFGALHRDKFRIATLPLTNEGLRLAALKGRDLDELIEKFNQGLINVKESGVYDQLLNQWDLLNPEKLID